MLNSNRIARLQAKYDHIRVTLGDSPAAVGGDHSALLGGGGGGGAAGEDGGVLTLTRRPNISRRRRIGKKIGGGEPKLFGGSLEDYLEETNQVRYISHFVLSVHFLTCLFLRTFPRSSGRACA